MRWLGLLSLSMLLTCIVSCVVLLAVKGDAASRVLPWMLGVGAVSLLLPVAVARMHLASSTELSAHEKRLWRVQLGFGLGGIIAAYFYVLRRDRHLSR